MTVCNNDDPPPPTGLKLMPFDLDDDADALSAG